MSDICICGECGFLCSTSELTSSFADLQNVKSFVKEIVKANNMSCRVCPACGSAKLFFKSSIATVNVPTVFSPVLGTVRQTNSGNVDFSSIKKEAEQELAKEEEVDADLISGVLESAEEEYDLASEDEAIRQLQEEVKKEAKEAPKKRRGRPTKSKKPVRRPNRIYKTCDSCQQKFECKDASSAGSKCEDCLNRMLG